MSDDDECANCGHTRDGHADYGDGHTPCQRAEGTCGDGCCVFPCPCQEFKERA